MSQLETLQECDQALQALLPTLPRPEQKAWAALVTGVVLAHEPGVFAASAAAPGASHDRAKQRRSQRLLANPRLDLPTAQQALIQRVVAGRRGRLPLLLDATTVGATAHQAGTVTLMLAMAWHGRALPLIWQTWQADTPGQDWGRAIQTMLRTVAAQLPPTVQPVLLTDRGLSGGPLARLATDLGWHYLLRVQGTTRVRTDDGQIRPLRQLVPTANTQALLPAGQIFAPRTKVGQTWISDWDAALVTNVVAVSQRVIKRGWRPLLEDRGAAVTTVSTLAVAGSSGCSVPITPAPVFLGITGITGG